MAQEFTVGIDYHQIAVFNPTLKAPFNDWTEVHIRQGFAWRPGSASFGTLSQAGQFKVRVSIPKSVLLPEGSVRAISVPFAVDPNGVEVGGVFDTVRLGIPAGQYQLVFVIQKLADQESEVYHFQFVAADQPDPCILLADAELEPPDELCMTAEPA